MLAEEDLVELYAAATSLEGDRVVGILEEEGIEATARETDSSSFPSTADTHFLILVPAHAQQRARVVIEEAVRDGVLSQDGALLA